MKPIYGREETLPYWFSNGISLFSRAVSRQVSSAPQSLTSVFGMGTGVSFASSAPAVFLLIRLSLSLESILDTFKTEQRRERRRTKIQWSSPRPISTCWLNTSQCLHLRPIYLVVFKGSYLITSVGYLILRPASRLDAFSVYPIHT